VFLIHFINTQNILICNDVLIKQIYLSLFVFKNKQEWFTKSRESTRPWAAILKLSALSGNGICAIYFDSGCIYSPRSKMMDQKRTVTRISWCLFVFMSSVSAVFSNNWSFV